MVGESIDEDKVFEFQINLQTAVTPPHEGGFEYLLNDTFAGYVNDGGIIALKHGEHATIVGLPEGTQYSIGESDYSSEGYISTGSNTTGEIVTEDSAQVDFVNQAPGSLTVRKTVDGNGGDEDKPFTFQVTLTHPAGVAGPSEYTFIGEGVPDGTIASGEPFIFTLMHGQSLTLVGIPAETSYEVEELDADTDGYITTAEGEEGTVDAGKAHTASFTNSRNVGQLTIKKIVDGNDGDKDQVFSFLVTIGEAGDSYAYIGDGVEDGTLSGGGDTIELKHGQRITLEGLLEGTAYTVEEVEADQDGYVTSVDSASGRIVRDTEHLALFTNSRNIGQLTLKKTVEGNAADKDKAFSFVVTLTQNGEEDPTVYQYVGTGVEDGSLKSGEVIALKHGQRITIQRLLEGTSYTVVEIEANQDGYITTAVDATGQIKRETNHLASFTNARYQGDLTISKTVDGIAGDQDRAFAFVVTLKQGGKEDTRSYAYTGQGLAGGSLKSGDTITLKHGQGITISGLPLGTDYTVTEETLVVFDVTAQGATGQVTVDKLSHTASFINTRNDVGDADIDVPKTGEGDDLARKVLALVTFSLMAIFISIKLYFKRAEQEELG